MPGQTNISASSVSEQIKRVPTSIIDFSILCCHLGDEMQEHTGAIACSKPTPSVLDLCAAPGGFIATALKYHPAATVCGISLPTVIGGHPLLVPHGKRDSRVTMEFLDITKLGHEFGLEMEYCVTPNLSIYRPWCGSSFDLVFCDGQVVRSQTNTEENRHGLQPILLCCSQLILAMQRMTEGGTLIMLLHKMEKWHNIQMLHTFSRFANIRLYKPPKIHATRGSFYMIATHVRPSSEAAQQAVERWKATWRAATFGVPEELDTEYASAAAVTEREVAAREVLDEFGCQFIQLAEPIWAVQKDALSKKTWTK